MYFYSGFSSSKFSPKIFPNSDNELGSMPLVPYIGVVEFLMYLVACTGLVYLLST